MATLKDAAMAYSGSREITDLDRLPTEVQVMEGSFKNKSNQDIKYYYCELNGIKYTIKSQALGKIKEMLTIRPQTKFIKINKSSDGQYSVIPLD
jgi:ribosomal 30S subunit maturation factor RimM